MLVSKNCLHFVEAGWKFCRSCGTSLEDSVEEAEILSDQSVEGARLVRFRISSGTYRASYVDGERRELKKLD